MALGRTKIGRRQRAETFADQQEAVEPDREIESYLAALAPEEDVETTGSGRRFGASQVYQLRLPLMANERLKELAARQGTSPDALARDWIMQHLSDTETSDPTPDPAWPQEDQRPPAHASSMHPQQFAEPSPYSYSEQQYPAAGYSPRASSPQPDPYDRYGTEETDTEITIPRGQPRYY